MSLTHLCESSQLELEQALLTGVQRTVTGGDFDYAEARLVP